MGLHEENNTVMQIHFIPDQVSAFLYLCAWRRSLLNRCWFYSRDLGSCYQVYSNAAWLGMFIPVYFVLLAVLVAVEMLSKTKREALN